MDALRFIKTYEWHSNVRQLHHVLMLSALNANFEKRNVITADALTAQLSDAGVPQVFEELKRKLKTGKFLQILTTGSMSARTISRKDFTKSITAIFQKLPKDPV